MTETDEAIIAYFNEGFSYADIAAAIGIGKNSVSTRISQLRKELGRDVLPSRGLSHKPANPNILESYRPEDLLTWAGAFKVLAYHMRDAGDTDGWTLARELARRKGMKNL